MSFNIDRIIKLKPVLTAFIEYIRDHILSSLSHNISSSNQFELIKNNPELLDLNLMDRLARLNNNDYLIKHIKNLFVTFANLNQQLS